jgi:abequosyltransferase
MKLSICITTFNRARFIGPTLESILGQLEDNCEVIVVDGASGDNTEQVVTRYARQFENLRYVKQSINGGIDRDYDCTVQLARGAYCWFMTDDDLLKPGAIARVLATIDRNVSLLLVNYERLDIRMSKVVLDRFLDMDTDARYFPAEMDKLFSDVRGLLTYIGCLVIKRSIWISRNRERYFDSTLMHIGVIFQERLPGDALIISEPLISYRDGNPRTFWSRMFEIFMVRYPAAVSSFAISEQAKRRYVEESSKTASLFLYRALGWYCFDDYRRWIHTNSSLIRQRAMPILIALTPGIVANALYIAFSVRRDRFREMVMLLLRMSPFYFRNYRFFGHRPD